MNENSKKMLFQAGVFTGSVLFLFLFLALFSILGRRNWERGLRAAVEQVLPQSEFTCGKILKIDSNYSVSAACFELYGQGGQKARAVILRAASYWGPIPAVFVCKDGKAEFKGAAYMNSSISKALDNEKNDKAALHWKKIAEEIAASAKEGEE